MAYSRGLPGGQEERWGKSTAENGLEIQMQRLGWGNSRHPYCLQCPGRNSQEGLQKHWPRRRLNVGNERQSQEDSAAPRALFQLCAEVEAGQGRRDPRPDATPRPIRGSARRRASCGPEPPGPRRELRFEVPHRRPLCCAWSAGNAAGSVPRTVARCPGTRGRVFCGWLRVSGRQLRLRFPSHILAGGGGACSARQPSGASDNPPVFCLNPSGGTWRSRARGGAGP